MDDVNPHDELTPELSNNIIRAHAKDGHDLLLKYHLPKMLADICQEHHGTMPILYFYAKAKNTWTGIWISRNSLIPALSRRARSPRF